jgi:AcrR family transcriptional regulator
MMSASTVRSRRAMSTEERRQEIVDRAAALFDRDGYSNTSMEAIAEGLDVAKPTLYHYFKRKEDILRSIHEDFISRLLARFEARLAAAETPEGLLLGAMTDIFRLMDTQRGYVRVFFEHHRELSPEARRQVLVERDRYEGYVRNAFEACIVNGSMRPHDARISTKALFGMCNWSYQWYRNGGQYTADEMAATMWSMLLEGLADR